jgi:hypothetical protein
MKYPGPGNQHQNYFDLNQQVIGLFASALNRLDSWTEHLVVSM